jgi:hypothetical protein
MARTLALIAAGFPAASLRSARLLTVSVLGVSVLAGPAMAGDPAPDNLELTCGGVFDRDSDYRRIEQVFGAANLRNEAIDAAEGETQQATILYPDDPQRRLEIFWADAASKRRPATIRTREEGSRWRVAGIGIGSSLPDVAGINGRPFKLSGFGWDYGGLVLDWSGGTLATPGAPDCRIQVTFSPTGPTPDRLMGDGAEISSDDPDLVASQPAVAEIGIGWPQE